MAPAKTAARSRRTQSYSWSSDSNAMRPVYQWPDDEEHHRTPPRTTTPVAGLRNVYEGDVSGDGGVRVTSRAFKPAVKKINYDSDSCLTPRSRRTLRRTLSGVTEPWPSVSAPASQPALDTIYSPTHEILHPMQSLLLEKSLSEDANKPSVSFVTVRTGSKGTHFTPTRTTQSVDFDSLEASSPRRTPVPFKLESYAFSKPREDEQGGDSVAMGGLVVSESGAEAQAPKNIVVIILDAEKKMTKFVALDWAIGVAVQPGDEIVILGVLKHVSSPNGYKLVANTDPLVGVSPELLKSEVQKITDAFEQSLSDSGRRADCQKKNVKLTVRIAPGVRARTVVVRELAALKATYAVFDRRVMRGTRYYNKHLSCHAVRMRSNGRSTKTIFTSSSQKTTTSSTPPSSSSSGSPTSDTSGSNSSSPTYFWRRFAPFKSNRNKWSSTTSSLSPRSSTASSDVASPSADVCLNLDSFMSEMQDFSISLDRSNGLSLGGHGDRSKVALQSCIVADALSYKQGMDSHRVKHRPISVTIPPICAT